jgi:hypothetical protein
MFLQVVPHAGPADRVFLREPEDCSRLHVGATTPDGQPIDDDTICDALRQSGAGESGDAQGTFRLRLAWLEARAKADGLPDGWTDKFTAMLTYARVSGWLDDAAGTVSVHVQRR